MHTIKLNDKQADLLKSFLGRAVIQGSEVVKFMDLARALGSAEVTADPVDMDVLEAASLPQDLKEVQSPVN